MRKKNPSTKKYHISRIAHWSFGNYCVIKCHYEAHLSECRQKLEEFANKLDNFLTHQEFLDMFENHITICKLPKEERRKYITWKTFARLQQEKNPCPVCKKFGIY
jgi:hypothetical protein